MTIECYLSNCPYHDAMLGLDPGPFCGESECDGLRAMHKEIGRLKAENDWLKAESGRLEILVWVCFHAASLNDEGRCKHCGAGDASHHSYSCPTGLHPDKRAAIELLALRERRYARNAAGGE